MKINKNLNSKSNLKYKRYCSFIILLGNTSALLAEASIYSQGGYKNFYITPVFFAAFILTIGYFLFKAIKYKNFFNFFIRQYRYFSKTPMAIIMSILCSIVLISRCLLPDEIVYYIQNILYVSSGILLFIGSVFLVIKK